MQTLTFDGFSAENAQIAINSALAQAQTASNGAADAQISVEGVQMEGTRYHARVRVTMATSKELEARELEQAERDRFRRGAQPTPEREDQDLQQELQEGHLAGALALNAAVRGGGGPLLVTPDEVSSIIPKVAAAGGAIGLAAEATRRAEKQKQEPVP